MASVAIKVMSNPAEGASDADEVAAHGESAVAYCFRWAALTPSNKFSMKVRNPSGENLSLLLLVCHRSILFLCTC